MLTTGIARRFRAGADHGSGKHAGRMAGAHGAALALAALGLAIALSLATLAIRRLRRR